MCGITGWLRYDNLPVNPEILDHMTDILAHRGPDGRGTYIDDVVGLGHRRLAIIDLTESGKQPMTNEDGTIWLTYNAEIYNFAEIRRELLARGHQFFSETDTEMVIHAYEEWGVDCVKRFNGMFAFALWDGKRRRLWIVRDRLGIKPLFYAHIPGRGFAFGSEIKSVLACPDVTREMDYEALAYYLSLNYTPSPYTLFQNVRQLLPGQYLLVDAGGQITQQTYWQLEYREDEKRLSEAEYAHQLEHLLNDAVRLRLMSDVPFGALLSGGVDSSSVVYWMSQHLNQPVKTFSIGFNAASEASFDERQYAREVAGMLGTNHYERGIDADLTELLPKFVWHGEEPIADSSMVAVYHVSELARQHVTMALGGDGADEILAGYETYTAYYYHRLYRMLPAFVRNRIIPGLVDMLPVSTDKVSWDFKLRRFVKSGGYTSEEAHATWRRIFDDVQRQNLLSPIGEHPATKADIVDLYRDYYAETNARHPLNRLLYVDTRFYLPNDMLVKVDRMSMAHGLEVRVPFLDHRLVEFAASVPPSLKLRNFRENKYLLKRVMTGKLPDSVLWRKKEGFNVPNAMWLKSRLRDFMLDHLSTTQIQSMGFLNAALVQQLIHDHLDGKADNSHQLWCLLTLSLWWQAFSKETVYDYQV